jgi:hypothetical protein
MHLLSVIAASRRRAAFDADAADYFARIATAGSSISANNQAAVNAFIVGCKADGIWGAIKASCFLAGPDDLTGALVPLVGPAPTNAGGNFASSDYSRATGIKGDGATKYLIANRNNNEDLQDNRSFGAWLSEVDSTGSIAAIMGATGGGTSPVSVIFTQIDGVSCTSRCGGSDSTGTFIAPTASGLIGCSRDNSSNYNRIVNSEIDTKNQPSGAPIDSQYGVFCRTNTGFSRHRISFYWFGESLSIALLNTRLTTYMSSIT